jgi:hypothetical protein
MRGAGNTAYRGFPPQVAGQDNEAGMGEREVLPGVRR